jgi:hypothetical protein
MTAFSVNRIRAIFEEHDVDKSGCLDLREAKQCLFKLQASDYINLSCCTCMTCYLNVSDDNRSACNFFCLSSSSQVPPRMLEEVMLNLDKDGSGTLDWEEFKISALQVALQPDPTTV